MSIPSSPAVWIVLILVVAAVVLWIVAKGRGFSFQRGKMKVSVSGEPQQPAKIEVASGLEAKGGKIGNVTGLRAEAGAPPPVGSVSVLGQARLSNEEVGDITGVEISARDSNRKK